jgi:apolipoprotein N-acyltransferase
MAQVPVVAGEEQAMGEDLQEAGLRIAAAVVGMLLLVLGVVTLERVTALVVVLAKAAGKLILLLVRVVVLALVWAREIRVALSRRGETRSPTTSKRTRP